MTRHPFNSSELGRDDAELTSLAEELEGLASGDPQPSAGFHDRVLAAIEAEPARRRSWLARFVAGDGRHLLQAAALAVVLVIGVAAALAAGGILDGLRRAPGGPTLLPSPSTVTQTITPSPSPSASPTPSASPSSGTPSAEPSASDDHASETPRPSESDDSGPGGGDASTSPRPSESDNSGPGGDDD